jgi:putative transcriptional regulator
MEIKYKNYQFSPDSGKLLVSEPFLADPNFKKSVILLCEHEAHGSVGFILNKLLEVDSDELLPGILDLNFPIYFGGPVEQNTLHFIHKVGHLIEDSFPIGNGVYWGGNLDSINEIFKSGKANMSDIKFFIGYSGWAEGQLDLEIEQKSWWLTDMDSSIIFNEEIEEIWPESVKKLGSDFAYLADSPEDFTWN